MPYDSGGSLQNSLSYTFTVAGPINDLGLSTILNYHSGSTNRLMLLPASGNTTLNGIDASGCSDGFQMIIVNTSATDDLIFNHLNSGSLPGNQFSNVSAGQVALLPLGAARCTYIANKWQFA